MKLLKFLLRFVPSLAPHPAELNFTYYAQVSMVLARRAAAERKQPAIDSEHLLLGILTIKDGAACQLLNLAGSKPDILKEQLEQSLPKGDTEIPKFSIPYAATLKKIFAYAVREAHEQDAKSTGTEHMIIGILRSGHDGAFARLRDTGLELQKLREIIHANGPILEHERLQQPAPTKAEPPLPASPATASAPTPISEQPSTTPSDPKESDGES